MAAHYGISPPRLEGSLDQHHPMFVCFPNIEPEQNDDLLRPLKGAFGVSRLCELCLKIFRKERKGVYSSSAKAPQMTFYTSEERLSSVG